MAPKYARLGQKRSRTKFNELRLVFSSDSPSMFHALAAQLFVLYEDLRLELSGVSAPKLGSLDGADVKYRMHYFIRRATGTWVEFSQALRTMDKDPDLLALKGSFDAESSKKWRNAVRFFTRYHSRVMRVRNDIGGHFGASAAKYAVGNLKPDVIGELELVSYGSRATMIPHFAGEIAATATLQHMPYRKLLRILRVGWKYGIYATPAITAHYYWKRF
jgi:hypothetical protein